MKTNAIATVMGLIVFSIFFFSSILYVTELGFVSILNKADFASDEDFVNEFNSRNEIAQIENGIWYTLITMTTIGYGDMAVSGSLSRVVLVIISIASAVFFPLFIVTVENLLEFGYQERMAFQIYNQITIKKQIKEVAAILMQKNLQRVNIINKLNGHERGLKITNKTGTMANLDDNANSEDEADDSINNFLDPKKKTIIP